MAIPAGASTLSLTELLSTYNLVTEGDLTSRQEIEGRAYVGGNLSGSTMQVGFRLTPGQGPSDSLVVVGNSTIGALHMQNGGDLRVGGNATGTIEMNAGTLATRTGRFGGTQSGPMNQGTRLTGLSGTPEFEGGFPDIDFAQLRAESQRLSQLEGTAVDTSDRNRVEFLGGAAARELTVLNVDLSILSIGGYAIDTQGAQTLLINVAGQTIDFAGNLLGSGSAAENVLWNFYEATHINVNTAIIGSVLAPFATMSNFAGSTEGSVIAREVNLTNGELHHRPFAGALPGGPGPRDDLDLPPGVIPLPAAGWLLLGGLGMLGLLRRRAA